MLMLIEILFNTRTTHIAYKIFKKICIIVFQVHDLRELCQTSRRNLYKILTKLI